MMGDQYFPYKFPEIGPRRFATPTVLAGGGGGSTFATPTLFVRKTGNDTTGDGLTAETAWLTIDKAIVNCTNGDVISVGPGTYVESHGSYHYFYPYKFNLTSTVIVQADEGAVTITDDGTQSENSTRIYGASYLKFIGIDFVGNGPKSFGVINFGNYETSGVVFEDCTLTWTPGGAASYGIFTNFSSAVLSNITFSGVTVIQDGASSGACVPVRFTKTSTGTISGLSIINCIVTSTDTPLMLEGLTDFLVDGGTFAGDDGYGILCGGDGLGGLAISGTIQNATISSTNGHACLIGSGANGVTVSGNTITGGNQGLVIKECQNVTATLNTVIGRSGVANTFYFKAAVDCSATYNTISSPVGSLVTIAANNNSPFNKCQNITFAHNIVTATGTATIFSWGDASDDLGGGVCDYNDYDIGGTSGNLGTVYGTAGLTTLVGLQGAWSTYDVTTNDANSTVTS